MYIFILFNCTCRILQGSFLKILLVGKTLTQRKTESNPLYSASYKPPYLSPTCSTTQCQKNYSERPQSIETTNRKKIEENLCCKLLTVNFSDVDWRQH